MPALPALVLLPETALSRRYLRILEKWIPVGVGAFARWPERPDCGHFLGGCHWYGIESIAGALAFAAAASSPDYDPAVGRCSREDLRTMARQAIRYLCFTHDSGPAECVRPAHGLGRAENCGTKWGERGLGFFRESQCGTTIAGLAIVARLLGNAVDAETWDMIRNVHADYAARFGEMTPKSGVYFNTQMEENGWTSCGLASVTCLLANDPQAATWAATAQRWMFSTATAPQDAANRAIFTDRKTVAEWTGETFTALPDYMAENHGMVHPNYTGASVLFTGYLSVICGVFGTPVPKHAYFNRSRIYEQLKLTTDRTGSLHPVQGMDWPYLFPDPGTMTHAAAAVLLRDADAARLERWALATLEARQASHQGRMVNADIAAICHDIQDPMAIRECLITGPAYTYLLHRLHGDGPKPTVAEALERKLRGVKVYPHSGFVFQRHPRGQTSFAWRNCIMALPLTSDGIQTVAPASDSWLGRVTVENRPDSHHEVSVHVATIGHGFAATLVMDRAQGAVRQEVLYAGLPDGAILSFERWVAREAVTVREVSQGFLRIINERFSAMPDNCRGFRDVITPGGRERFEGFVSADPTTDVSRLYNHPAWLNIDDRLGLVFRGSGVTVYHNRHHFSPWWATADDLILSRTTAVQRVRHGDTVSRLAALILPDHTAKQTASAHLLELAAPDGCVAFITRGHLAAACFRGARAQILLRARRDQFTVIPIFEGTTRVTGRAIAHAVALPAGQALLRVALAHVEITGDVALTASPAALLAQNIGREQATVSLGRKSIRLRPAQIAALA